MTGRLSRNVRRTLEQLERRDMMSVGPLAPFRPTPVTVADDYGNTFADSALISLSSTGAAIQSGKIEQTRDVDVFRFVAPVSGQMTIRQQATRLDSYLAAYDSRGKLIAQNDNAGSGRDSLVEFDAVAGNTYYLKAAGRARSTGTYNLAISTTAADGGTTSEDGFQIDVTVSGMTSAEQAIIQQAVDRWEQIIVGDLPDVAYRGQLIDDIQIAISAITIDGEDGVLGQSTATAFRKDSDLPYLGYIQLDTADVAAMASDGSLLGVIEHEVAHVLGFGVIWSDLGLLTGTRTSSPGFTGAQAVAEYNALFGTSVTAVPVEADGGSGTRLSHWEESVFNNELMTGWYNSGQTNPISRISVASMADLGYEVNMAAADAYTVPSTSASTSSSVVRNLSSVRISAAIAASRVTASPWGMSNDFFRPGSSTDPLRAVDLVIGQAVRGRI
jgi:hypothetical protein